MKCNRRNIHPMVGERTYFVFFLTVKLFSMSFLTRSSKFFGLPNQLNLIKLNKYLGPIFLRDILPDRHVYLYEETN